MKNAFGWTNMFETRYVTEYACLVNDQCYNPPCNDKHTVQHSRQSIPATILRTLQDLEEIDNSCNRSVLYDGNYLKKQDLQNNENPNSYFIFHRTFCKKPSIVGSKTNLLKEIFTSCLRC